MTDLEILTAEFCNLWNSYLDSLADVAIHKGAIKSLLTQKPDLSETVNELLSDSKQLPALLELTKEINVSVLEPLLQKLSAELRQTIRERLSISEDS